MNINRTDRPRVPAPVSLIPTPVEKRLQLKVNGDCWSTTVEAHGEVDVATAPHLETILRLMANPREANVVVDLRHTTYLGTPGITALLAAHRRRSGAPSPLEVQVSAGSQPERVLRRAEAHRLFSVVVWDSPCAPPALEHPGMVQGNLELRIPADVFQVCRVRHITEQVLLLTGVDDGWICDFVTAVGEAVANAVTHGSPAGTPGYVIFSLKPGPEVVTAEIQDFGHGISDWRGHPEMPPPQSIRGRGLGMMSLLADNLEVQTGPTGTLVRIHKGLDIPAVV